MYFGSWWVLKDRLMKWAPEKEADESRRAAGRASQPSVEERLERGRAETERLRKGLGGPRPRD